ncbi:MAG: DNA alkylation repair protein [Actinomycetota bacterium]
MSRASTDHPAKGKVGGRWSCCTDAPKAQPNAPKPVDDRDLTARRFLDRLEELRSPEQQQALQRYFKTGAGEYGEGDLFIGVKMGQVFALAKEFIDLPLSEIETLLDSPIHEARAGALSIMDKQARRKRTPARRRRELFELYLRRHDRINNWDLVDVACRFVIGVWLWDKPRDILYQLARSDNIWERRTAIVSTWYFIREGDLDDAYRLSELLLGDRHDLIHKAAGWMLRYAGDKDPARLLQFLDRHAAAMPRTMLRYAIEHLDHEARKHYLGLKRSTAG